MDKPKKSIIEVQGRSITVLSHTSDEAGYINAYRKLWDSEPYENEDFAAL